MINPNEKTWDTLDVEKEELAFYNQVFFMQFQQYTSVTDATAAAIAAVDQRRKYFGKTE